MGSCYECHGTGSIVSNNLESCASCGGRGYGGYTDVACVSCQGNGQSTTHKRDSCWNCSGSGWLEEAEKRKDAGIQGGMGKVKSTTPSSSPKQSKSESGGVISVLSFICAIAIGALLLSADTSTFDALLLSAIGFCAFWVVLNLAFYVLKGVFVLVQFIVVAGFWFFIAVVLGNAAEFQWAMNIANAF